MNENDSGEHMQPDENVMPQSSLSAGAQLAAARQARGWSIEDVAAQLNLAPRQVLAIESDNHAALPGMPITRGFIRAYAKLLKIDAAPLLVALGGESAAPTATVPPRKHVAAPFAESRMPSLGERKRSSMPVAAIVIALVLGGAGYWLFQNKELVADLPGTSKKSADQEQAPVVEQAPAPSGAGGAMVSTPPAGDTAAAPASAPAPGTSSSVSEPAAQGASAATPAGLVPAQGASATNAASAAVGKNEDLLLTAREETWVEVRRVNGNTVLLSRLLKAGESHTLAVNEPLSLVIGNARGVDLTLRGTPLPLKAASGNVSKITVK